MKNLLGFLFSVLIGINIFTMQAFAANTNDEESLLIDREVIVNSESVVEENTCFSNELAGVEIDELLLNSTNVTRSGSTIVGSYRSNEFDAGFPGFTYDISFDWEFEVVDGEYVFKDNNISNAYVTTYIDWYQVEMAFQNYSYTLVKNTYSVASDGKSVTFYTNYEFELQDIYSLSMHTFSQDNTQTITISDLI